MNTHTITINAGKGALQTPPDVLATRFRLAATPALANWSQPYYVPATLTQRDQDGSSSCTAQATCYQCEALEQVENSKSERYSARHIYSQTNAGFNQGAYIWKAMSIPLIGLASANSVPDGDSSETVMIDKSDNANAIIEARADKYAVIPRASIDQLAQVVKDYHGFVTGFNGFNGMFAADGTIIKWDHSEWGHAVYVDGFEIRNGVKCLRFKNSWTDKWGTMGWGYMPEEFINSGLVFDAYTYADIADLDPQSMFKLVQVQGQKDVWLVKDGKRSLIYNASALMIVADFSSIQPISQADLNAIPDTGKSLASIDQE